MPGVKIPPSLRNIYSELASDTGANNSNHGSLLHWAEQGVLLLNAVLTVREGQPNSHKGIGWERFTDAIMEKLNERDTPLVFILWGSHAQQKGALSTRAVIKSSSRRIRVRSRLTGASSAAVRSRGRMNF